MHRNKADGAKRPQQLPTIAVFERLGVWEPAFPREFSWRNGGGVIMRIRCQVMVLDRGHMGNVELYHKSGISRGGKCVAGGEASS